MDSFFLIHIPFEIGRIRIYKTSGSREEVFKKMKMKVLGEFSGISDLNDLLESKGYKVSQKSGIIFDEDNEWKLVSESEIINL